MRDSIDYLRIKKNEYNMLCFPDGEALKAEFPINEWSKEAFEFAHIKGYEPMLAKELDTEEAQNEKMGDPNYFIEEKFDGTRGIVQFFAQEDIDGNKVGYCRVFSRRISKKTNFYAENTDSLPQIRDLDFPDLAGTVLDGEMFIDGKPFKEVSSALNCLWDRAIERQLESGFISLHAFDIIKYRGVDLRHMPLKRRKFYLHSVIEELDSPFIKEVPYYECGNFMKKDSAVVLMETLIRNRCGDSYPQKLLNEHKYPNLYTALRTGKATPRAYYELIVATEGEGVIVKPQDGKYYHKRGWEYSKIKKFLTREAIILDFTEPTKEYDGKFPNDRWEYWYDESKKSRVPLNTVRNRKASELLKEKLIPVTKNWYEKLVGNLVFGVIINAEEKKALPKNKKFEFMTLNLPDIPRPVECIVCGECSGMTDEEREYFTEHNSIGSVVEIKANEIFSDTGKLRHPRFLRLRDDKGAYQCVWSDYLYQ